VSGRPYLDQIIFQFRLVDESRVQALRSGDLSWADAVPLQDVNTLKNDPAFSHVTSLNAGIPDITVFNTSKPPFNNKALRQAVALATDRTAIRDVAYFGAGELGVEEVASASPFYDGVVPFGASPDLTMAKAKLAEAGIGPGFQIEYLGLPQYPELLKDGEVTQQNLKAIGIDMKITQLDVSIWFARYQKGDYQVVSGYYAGMADPDIFYNEYLYSTGGANFSRYANPQADALIDQARAATDVGQRKSLYAQLRKIIADDVPLTFVHYETINYFMGGKVAGSTVNPDLQLRLENVGFTG
jgi:peptide/nickel transport system substrate-binding protein